MMRDKTCPVCGDELATMPWGKGLVWQCSDHGVKEWYFDADPGDAWAERAARGLDAGLDAMRPREPDFRRR